MADDNSEYDLFLDGLDDIPNMMELVKNAPASPHRFRVFPNNSHGMDQTFKGHCDIEKHKFANQSREMVRQASRVLERMSSVDSNSSRRNYPKQSRPTNEVADIMTKHLQDERGGMLFKNLDPHQHGHITQDDFIHILSTKNTGLSRNEMKEMANELDSDRSGLLNYSHMYSALDALKTPQAVEEDSSYSKAFEESKRGESNSGGAKGYSQSFEESRSFQEETQKSEAVECHPISPPRPYDGLQQYINCQAKVEKEKFDMEEIRRNNESRYGDSFDRATLVEKPSNSFAPELSVKVSDNVERYARGSGNIPSYSTPAGINDIVFNRFVTGRTGKKNAAVFDNDEIVGTVDYDKVGDIICNDSDDTASSYTKAYESLRSTLSHQSEGKENREEGKGGASAQSQRHHHKSFAALPTSKVTGGVDPEERMYLGNPSTGRNRNSRAFHNSFILDHRVPDRLRRHERSHSAPPGKRHYDTLDNKKTSNTAVSDPRLESVGSLFRYLSDISEGGEAKTIVSSPVRSQKKHGGLEAGEAERKNFADFACAPPSAPKKKVVSNSKKSMNTLVTQLNNHSKIKILNHKMKRIDVSNSGFVNKSEFAAALKEMGVKISAQQVNSLYETHAKDNVGLDINQTSSLKLCTHQRGINVQDFIQKMRTRTSSSMLSARRHLEDTSHTVVPTSESNKTPLEKEDARVWKKVVEALSEENSGGKRIIADFFRDAQVNHQNEVHADKLFSELNHVGSNVNDVEFRNMLSTVRRKSNGNVDVDDFTREYHKRSVECRDQDKWMTLMPSLASPSKQAEANLIAQGEKLKRVLKTQKKHFVKKQGCESANDPNYRTDNFKQRLNNPVVAATKSFEQSHVPACLTMSDAKEFRDERLKWSKLSSKFLNHKDSLLTAFGGEEGIHQPLSENLMKDKLYEAGVLLGSDDIKILKSYATTSSSQEAGDNTELTFGKMCSSMGLNLDKDNRRRMTLTSPADVEHDSGIFGSSAKSVTSGPNYHSSMLSTFDNKFTKGNQKKRINDSTGQLLPGAPQPMSSGSASEFWEMKHVPEIQKLPAKQLSYHQRLQLPEDNLQTSVNGGTGRGFTSLRKMKEARKRSSSAPPRYSTMTRNVEEQGNARTHMWQRESYVAAGGTLSGILGGGGGRDSGVVVVVGGGDDNRAAAPITGVNPSRFAAAPLAEYIAARQPQERGESSHAPMTTQDLQMSYSSEMDAR